MEALAHAYKLILVFTIAINAKFISVDKLNNIYAVTTENVLVKYDSTGKKRYTYSNIKYGDISSIDVSDPLRPLVYYNSTQVLVNTDVNLSPVNEISLRNKPNPMTAAAVCRSSDNMIWVYDIQNIRLIKLNNNGDILTQSIELNAQLGFVPDTKSLYANNQNIFICDTSAGVIIYDEYGNYLRNYSAKKPSSLQIFNQSIIFMQEGKMFEYNYKTFQLSELPFSIDNDIKQALLSNGNMITLNENGVNLYRIQTE